MRATPRRSKSREIISWTYTAVAGFLADSDSLVRLVEDVPKSFSPPVDQQQAHRRQISGFVNNHRPVPPMTSSTPPQRSSVTEQQLFEQNHRAHSHYSTPMANENPESELKNSRKTYCSASDQNRHRDQRQLLRRSPINENRFPTPPPLSTSATSPSRSEEILLDEKKVRSISFWPKKKSRTISARRAEWFRSCMNFDRPTPDQESPIPTKDHVRIPYLSVGP